MRVACEFALAFLTFMELSGQQKCCLKFTHLNYNIGFIRQKENE